MNGSNQRPRHGSSNALVFFISSDSVIIPFQALPFFINRSQLDSGDSMGRAQNQADARRIELLEARLVLSFVGPDLTFGDAGAASAAANVAVFPLHTGRILAVDLNVVRLNDNGSID